VLPFLSLTLGCILFVACWQILDLLWHRYRGVKTVGKVLRLEAEETTEGGPVFRPIIEYEMDGRTCRLKPLIAMAPALYHEGQELPVYYFPNHPGSGRIVTPREFFKWTVVIASCLLFLALLLNANSPPSLPEN
jgi:hypothetical protein